MYTTIIMWILGGLIIFTYGFIQSCKFNKRLKKKQERITYFFFAIFWPILICLSFGIMLGDLYSKTKDYLLKRYIQWKYK